MTPTPVTLEDGTVVEYGSRRRPVLHLSAPLVTLGAVWAARRGMSLAYERATGRTPPAPRSPATSWGKALAWAAVTATTAAVIEVTVHRLADERTVRIVALGRDSLARRRA